VIHIILPVDWPGGNSAKLKKLQQAGSSGSNPPCYACNGSMCTRVSIRQRERAFRIAVDQSHANRLYGIWGDFGGKFLSRSRPLSRLQPGLNGRPHMPSVGLTWGPPFVLTWRAVGSSSASGVQVRPDRTVRTTDMTEPRKATPLPHPERCG
jgi:hypothetical protein